MPEFSFSIPVDKVKEVWDDFKVFADKRVLVGVPEEASGRGKGGITNAALAYIHDNGSPRKGIPARKFMTPGVEKVQGVVNEQLLVAAKAKMADDEDGFERELHKVGLTVQSSIKKVINEGVGFTPLKRSTLLGRTAKRKNAWKGSKEKREEIMGSMHPLVDTGQLRNSILYVIEDRASEVRQVKEKGVD